MDSVDHVTSLIGLINHMTHRFFSFYGTEDKRKEAGRVVEFHRFPSLLLVILWLSFSVFRGKFQIVHS